MAKRHDRQSGIIKAGDLRFPIHVLGAGGIGSWTVLLLAKMGCDNIIVYDNDKVEEHNVASQFFKEEQLGMLKVEALANNVLEQTGVEIEQVKNIKEEDYIDKGLVVIAIDSMSERIRLGELYKDRDIFIIDGRMGGLTFEIYNTYSYSYLETTVSPDKVSPDKCTEKSISFNCAAIGSAIANQVRKFAKQDTSFLGEIIYCFNTQTLLKKSYNVPTLTQTGGITGVAAAVSEAIGIPQEELVTETEEASLTERIDQQLANLTTDDSEDTTNPENVPF